MLPQLFLEFYLTCFSTLTILPRKYRNLSFKNIGGCAVSAQHESKDIK